MSITKKGEPGVPSPGYNPLKYYILSNNVGQPGFRYLWKVYSAGTSTLLGTWKTAIRSQDNFGELDLQKCLSNFLTYTNPFTNSSSIDAVGSYKLFDVKLYEEYNIPWLYQDFQFVGTAGVYYGYTKLIQLTPTTAHSFVAGDQVNISTTTTGVTAPINGLHTIINVPDAYSVIIDLVFPGSGGTIGGTIKYADNRKTTSAILGTFSSQAVFNGALPFTQFPNYNPSVYGLSASSPNYTGAITNMPVGTNGSDSALWVTPTQDLYINYINTQHSTVGSTQSIRFTNSNGDIITQVIWDGSTNQGYERQVCVGPNNASANTVISGTAGIVKSNTEWVEFETFSPTQTTSKKYRYYIDRRCRIETYEILFMDRMGSFLSYSFSLRSKESITMLSDTYKQRVGDFVTNKYSYNSYDNGTTTYNSSVDRSLELNTDWMNDTMSVLFEEMLTSPTTFIKGGIFGEDYVSVSIQDKSFKTDRQRNKVLIRKTINVMLDNQNNINC